MAEEEKQAISKLREIIEYDKKHRIETIYDKEQIEFRNNIELVLDLIEKLQKENEELKLKDYYLPAWVTKKYVSKDKIREAKKYLEYYLIGNLEYENCQNEFKKILKLLEEGK